MRKLPLLVIIGTVLGITLWLAILVGLTPH
jgi:hypothetical protein